MTLQWRRLLPSTWQLHLLMVWQEEYRLKKQVALHFKDNEALQCKNRDQKLKCRFPEQNSDFLFLDQVSDVGN